jgi:hypothetical protein
MMPTDSPGEDVAKFFYFIAESALTKAIGVPRPVLILPV